MTLSSLCIKRPILVSVWSAFILLFGYIGLTKIGVREYPAIDPPTVTVSTTFSGANAEVVESQITELLEQSLNGIDGVRSIASTSQSERSTITVEFLLGVDMERAANDVRDRVSRATRNLPANANAPAVAKADADASPILLYGLYSTKRSLLQLTDQATTLQEKLQTVAGVSEVRIFGERKRAMRLRINPMRLSAYGLTLSDLKTVLTAENADLPVGELEGQTQSVSLRAQTGLATVEEFRRMILKTDGQSVVRLEDVAIVEEAAENEKALFRVNGSPGLGMAVIAQPGANQIAISDGIQKKISELRSALPADYTLEQVFDNTNFVRQSLSEVRETILIAFALVVAVIFLFLREWRTTLIPVLSIPVSLVGVFFLVWIMDFSLNVLTLLGVVLAIGLVVDDAIVVLENIYTRIEKGMPPREAAVKGLQEIFFAVVATTLVLAAVFTPLLFLDGFTGRLFREFGFVVGGSVLLSGFISLTLVGMLSSRLLKARQKHHWFYRSTEPWFLALNNGYRSLLKSVLQRPFIPITILITSIIVVFFCIRNLPRELAPMEDRSALSVSIAGFDGATFNYMDGTMQKAQAIIEKEVPECRVLMMNTSGGSGGLRLMLVPPEERKRSQKEIASDLMKKLNRLDGVKINVTQQQTIQVGARASLPVQMVVLAGNLDSLREALGRLQNAAQKDSLFSVVNVDLKFTKPQLDVYVDRERLRSLGITPTDVATAMQLAYGGVRYGYYLQEGRQYQILGELQASDKSSPQALQKMMVRSKSGELHPLSSLVTLKEKAVPPQLFRFNRWSSAVISADLSPGYTVGDGMKRMESLAKQTLGESVHTEWTGSSRDFAESSSSLLQVFLLSLLIVYLLLAAQFESLREPLVIMTTVPLALAGALASLWITGNSLNLFSEIGLVMLVGLVTKNGILIVEFANQRKETGLGNFEAVLEASVARLRPILMTTLATVLGSLPIAFALGAGSESRVPMGVVLVGGLLSALSLTLFVVPSLYLMLSPRRPIPSEHSA